MENKNTDLSFNYTYSAKEQEEIKRIRQKYQSQKEDDDISRLRKMDAKVTQKAVAISLSVGITGALILGSGMSLLMTDLGLLLGMQGRNTLLLGIGVGLVGSIFVGLAYPIYSTVLKKERKKIAPEILSLTEGLIK